MDTAGSRSKQVPYIVLGVLFLAVSAWGLAAFPLDETNPFVWMIGAMLVGGVILIPSLGILLLLVTMWLSTMFASEGGLTLNRLVGAVTALGFLVRKTITGGERLVLDKYDLLFALYFVAATISVAFNTVYEKTQGRFWELIIGYLIFFMIRNIINSRQKLRWVLWASVFSILPVAISVVSRLGDELLRAERRIYGIRDVNATGNLSYLAIVLVLYLVDSSKSRLRNFYYLLIPIFGMAIILSGNRSGLLALGITIFLLFAISTKRTQKFKIVLVLIPLLVWVFILADYYAPRTVERVLNIPVSQLFLNADEITDIYSVDRRVFITRAALEMFLDHPIAGVGFGGFSEIFGQYSPFQTSQAVAHNIFLNTLSEMGLVGISVLVIFYFVILMDLWRAKNKGDITSRRAVEYMLTLVIGFNIIIASLHFINITREMYTLFALALVAKGFSESPEGAAEEESLVAEQSLPAAF